jgi:protein TonB
MLAYAADMPRTAQRTNSPKALTLIIAGHALVIAAVMATKMEVIGPFIDEVPTLIPIQPLPPPPKPVDEVEPQPQRPIAQPSFIDQERPIVDMERQGPIEIASGPSFGDLETVIGSIPNVANDPPRHAPVMTGPRLATSEASLKPPYPTDKLRAEEEATLQLRLTIDARGRVTAVDPVGAADPSFLAAARRHILRSWRYKPATEDGVAVPTTTLISLSFRLEDV